MLTRIVTGVVLAAVVTGSLVTASPFYFAVLVLVAALLGLHELQGLTAKLGAPLFIYLSWFFAVLLWLGALTGRFERAGEIMLACTTMSLIGALRGRRDLKERTLSALFTIGGVAYVGLLSSAAVAVRSLTGLYSNTGARLLGLMILTIVASDTGAFFAGITLGRRKLAPRISPGKTMEGSIAGLLLAIVCAWIYRRWFLWQTPIDETFVFVVLLVAAGTLGDLVESLIKRAAGVKDASAILPGHGGVLDRIDSMLFASAVLYLCARYWFL